MVDGAEEILKSNNNLKIFIEFWLDGLTKLGTEPLRMLQRAQRIWL